MQRQPTLHGQMKEILATVRGSGRRPALLLHVCCAPCAAVPLLWLTGVFSVEAYFCNPNIWPEEERLRRCAELERLLSSLELPSPVPLTDAGPDPGGFARGIRGLEGEPEGGRRCQVCFSLRLEATAREAARRGIPWFATTLSLGSRKDARGILAAGMTQEEATGVRFLPADFKKEEGGLRSIRISQRYGLYRQRYCGCRYSITEETADRKGKTP